MISIDAAGTFTGCGDAKVVAEMMPAVTAKIPISITTPRISALAFSFAAVGSSWVKRWWGSESSRPGPGGCRYPAGARST